MGLHWEVIVPLILLAVLIFGARRLPEIGSAAGQTIRSFQKAMREGQDPPEGQQALPSPSDEQTTPRP